MKICGLYYSLLTEILNKGIWRDDPNRKGTKRLQIPFYSMTVDLREGFPLLTTKKMWWKGIVGETLWLLKGNSNIKELVNQGINIWNKDAYNYFLKITRNRFKMPYNIWLNEVKQENKIGDTNQIAGDIGKMYGVQWRSWGPDKLKVINNQIIKPIDQLSNIIQQIKDNPLSSNHVIFGDNPTDRDKQALPCCMNMMQFSCEPVKLETGMNTWMYKNRKKHYLDLSINYRSHDVLLGYPWNVAQYALILEIIAKITNKIPRYLRINSQNVHLYDNQIDAAKEQIERSTGNFDLPKFKMSPIVLAYLEHKSIDDMLENCRVNQFILEDYKSFDQLKNQPEMIGYKI